MKKSFLHVNRKIKKLRLDTGWTQAELAKNANITASALNMIEATKRLPTLPVCQKIAKALNVPLVELVGDETVAHDEMAVFFRQYQDIRKLSQKDKALILKLVERLK